MNDYAQYPNTNVKTPTLTIWQRVFFSPAVETFARYLPEADLMRAVLWLILGTLGSGIIGILNVVFNLGGSGGKEIMRMLQQELPPELARELPAALPGIGSLSLGATLCGIPSIIILSLISTFITVGLIHLAAKLLQGQGNYTDTFFLMAAAAAPMMIVTSVLQLISGLLGLIPLLGTILSLLISLILMGLGVYGLVLTSMAVAAAHSFSLGKGFLSAILPGVIFFILTCCCTVIAMVAAGSAIDQGTIDELLREIGAYLTLHI
ncbi:MAG: YIP1 family protein [Chloroflexota bacterium]|nr:YIP1 family protein [Chloroflexota bacterium]